MDRIEKIKVLETHGLIIDNSWTDEMINNRFKVVYKGAVKDYDVLIDDVIGLDNVKKELEKQMAVFENKEEFLELGIKTTSGLLIYGMPGTGKTWITKAIASTYPNVKVRLITIADIGSSKVGETDKLVNGLFDWVRKQEPNNVILIFDEIEMIVPKRSKNPGVLTLERISAMLRNMDGLEDNNNLFIIGTTNKPGDIDIAFRRSGRLEAGICVHLPTVQERIQLAKMYIKTPIEHINEKVFKIIGEHTINCTGADFSRIGREIHIHYVMQRKINPDYKLNAETLVNLIQEFKKQQGLSEEQMKLYTEEYKLFEEDL